MRTKEGMGGGGAAGDSGGSGGTGGCRGEREVLGEVGRWGTSAPGGRQIALRIAEGKKGER